MAAPGWPATLSEGRVGLRALRLRDASAWTEVRLRNVDWLAPWEATPPRARWLEHHTATTYTAMLRSLRRQARAGTALPFAITYEGDFVGQLTVSNVVRGALNSAFVGYWVDGAVAGRGVMPTALALGVDHLFAAREAGGVSLHRVEADIRPENVASRRVVEKLGFREEGLLRRYLFIDGAYRDHIAYALTVEDVPGGLLRRWRSAHR